MKDTIRFKGLRYAAAAILVATLLFWGLKGAHLGWTQASVVAMQVDEITGIEYPVREDTLVPGVEFLALGFGLSVLVLGASFLPGFGRSRSAA